MSTVFGKVGRAETATDPAPVSMAETIVRLKPRDQWPKVARRRWYSDWAPGPMKRLLRPLWPDETPATKAELIEALDRAARLRGWNNGWTAPARARMDMTATGVRTPVGIKIVGPDAGRVDALAAAVRAVALHTAGAKSASTESLGGEPRLTFAPDPAALARHHADGARVTAIADLIISGGRIAELPPRQAGATPIRVRVLPYPTPLRDEDVRHPDELLRETTTRAGTQPVALAVLGRPAYITPPASLRFEHGEPVAYVQVDLDDGVDVLGYVTAASASWRGRSPRTSRARAGRAHRVDRPVPAARGGPAPPEVVAPIVGLSMLLLLVPAVSQPDRGADRAGVGAVRAGRSVWACSSWIIRCPRRCGSACSPSRSGDADRRGHGRLHRRRVSPPPSRGPAPRPRRHRGRARGRDGAAATPKIMTISTMAAGLLPLLWSDGAGAEIMRRVAAPMIGGLAPARS